jgi:hypothetical protein
MQTILYKVLPFRQRRQHPPGGVALAFAFIEQSDKVALTAALPQILSLVFQKRQRQALVQHRIEQRGNKLRALVQEIERLL